MTTQILLRTTRAEIVLNGALVPPGALLNADTLAGVTPGATGLALLPTATAAAARTVLGLGESDSVTFSGVSGTSLSATGGSGNCVVVAVSSSARYRRSTQDGLVEIVGGTTPGTDASIALYGSTHSTYANEGFINANKITFAGASGSGATLTAVVLGTDPASAGLFRLATHTTSAGGIALGPDCPVFRAAAGVIGIGDGTTPISTATTVGAAGGASAPPATPTGYLRLSVNGTIFKFAYYADA